MNTGVWTSGIRTILVDKKYQTILITVIYKKFKNNQFQTLLKITIFGYYFMKTN